MGVHPYTDGSPTTDPHMGTDVAAMYNTMIAHGDGAKKVWGTEYGVPTGGPWSVAESTQAEYVDQAVDAWYAKAYTGPLFWYSARDTGTSPDDREQHFGLLRFDGSAKPAYARLGARFSRLP